jgi:signal peptide peptidase SppA
MITLGTQRHVALADGVEAGFVECLHRLAAGPAPVNGAVWIDEEGGGRLYEAVGPLAVIGVRGYLVDYLPFHGAEWVTGYNCLRLAVETARRDPEIRAIALAVNSPGGLVSGCFELVEWLRGVADEIPLFAVVESLCASAAFALASSCKAGISAPVTSAVGSIGVYRLHMDISKYLEKAGIAMTAVKSGDWKTAGSPYGPLGQEVEADWQETVDAYRDLFAEHVSAGRGVSRDDVLATEARLYDGPVGIRKALDLGLIDGILPPDEAFARILDQAAAAA